MILELDAGNTFLKWRLVSLQGDVKRRGQLYTRDQAQVDWQGVLGEATVDVIRVASVAGAEFNKRLSVRLNECYGVDVKFASTALEQAGVINSYEDPSRMGVDRWLVMLAAWNDCRAPCCIVDCGSAITVEYLDEGGRHEGGYIMPGLRLLKSSLLTNTAEILVDRTAEGFSTEPGCHTSAAVEHGINLMFKALQEKIQHEEAESARVVQLADRLEQHARRSVDALYGPRLEQLEQR